MLELIKTVALWLGYIVLIEFLLLLAYALYCVIKEVMQREK